MQKKICYVLIGYIFVIILAGGWLALQSQEEQVAILEEFLAEDLTLQEENQDNDVEKKDELKEEYEIIQEYEIKEKEKEIEEKEKVIEERVNDVYKENLDLDLPEQSGETDNSSKDFWGEYYDLAQSDNLADEVASKMENTEVSITDKVKALYIIKKNLSKEDISYLFSLSKDGITSEEKNEVKVLLEEKLSEKDYEQLKTLIFKYL